MPGSTAIARSAYSAASRIPGLGEPLGGGRERRPVVVVDGARDAGSARPQRRGDPLAVEAPRRGAPAPRARSRRRRPGARARPPPPATESRRRPRRSAVRPARPAPIAEGPPRAPRADAARPRERPGRGSHPPSRRARRARGLGGGAGRRHGGADRIYSGRCSTSLPSRGHCASSGPSSSWRERTRSRCGPTRTARAVEALDDLPARAEAGRLTEVPGIGEALAKKIGELHRTGRLELLDRLRAKHPPGILELLQVPELGPRKIAALHAALGVGHGRRARGGLQRRPRPRREGLRREDGGEDPRGAAAPARARSRAARAARRRARDGGGDRPAPARRARRARGRDRRDPCGGGRRRSAISTSSPRPAIPARSRRGSPRTRSSSGRSRAEARRRAWSSPRGCRWISASCRPRTSPPLLHHFTGSKAHHVRLRGHRAGARLHALRVGPPPLRPPGASARGRAPRIRSEGADRERGRAVRGARAAADPAGAARGRRARSRRRWRARCRRISSRLEDVRGHRPLPHRPARTGAHSLEEMARAAEALGHGVPHHHRSLADRAATPAASTLDRLRAAVGRDRARPGAGERCGSCAAPSRTSSTTARSTIPTACSSSSTSSIASVHSRMKMDEDAMTRGSCAACRCRCSRSGATRSGGSCSSASPFACRVEEVLDALAASRGAVEVNGDPQPAGARAALAARRDRARHPVRALGRRALGAGPRYLRYAVTVARRGWVRRGEVLNTPPGRGVPPRGAGRWRERHCTTAREQRSLLGLGPRASGPTSNGALA